MRYKPCNRPNNNNNVFSSAFARICSIAGLQKKTTQPIFTKFGDRHMKDEDVGGNVQHVTLRLKLDVGLETYPQYAVIRVGGRVSRGICLISPIL